MRYGAWQTERLLATWQTHVAGQGKWQASQYAGYYTKAVDLTAYWRPTLKGLKSKHYDGEANKALPAVVFGMVGRVGRVGQQRMALLTDLIRADLTDLFADEDPRDVEGLSRAAHALILLRRPPGSGSLFVSALPFELLLYSHEWGHGESK